METTTLSAPMYSAVKQIDTYEDDSTDKEYVRQRWIYQTVPIRTPVLILALVFQICALWTMASLIMIPKTQCDPHSMGYCESYPDVNSLSILDPKELTIRPLDPAAEAISYHEITFTDDDRFKTLSNETPAPETDMAWKDLQARLLKTPSRFSVGGVMLTVASCRRSDLGVGRSRV